MRPRSLKRQRQDRRDRAGLDVFCLEHSHCWKCGKPDAPWNRLTVHHVAGRNHPQRDARANWARLCQVCHAEFTDSKVVWKGLRNKTAGVVLCLALKSMHDPEHYDRLAVLRILGWGPEAVSEAEVLEAVERLEGRAA